MTTIVRAADRYRSSHGGVESWHCFSAGAHYDPGNVSHGALVGCDEHLVAPSAGFDWHAHRGVDILSWVLEGALHHEDDRGADVVIGAGEEFRQSAGDGIRHRETNPSAYLPLRLVQMTVLPDAGARFAVWREAAQTRASWWHAFVARGAWRVEGVELLPGDSVRGRDTMTASGCGELLVWTA